jgi:hypothetical protein
MANRTKKKIMQQCPERNPYLDAQCLLEKDHAGDHISDRALVDWKNLNKKANPSSQ